MATLRILRDVTSDVTHTAPTPDGELLSITKCLCGKTFPEWYVIVSTDKNLPDLCPCAKSLYFEQTAATCAVRVMQAIPKE